MNLATEEQIGARLDAVLVPGAMRSLVKMNLVRDIQVAGDEARVTLASAAVDSGAQEWLRAKVTDELKASLGTSAVEVEFVDAAPKELNDVGSIVAVMSGKGGVGKSLVTGLLGIALARRGYDVGILDADITGPSIPRMFGISGRPAGSETGVLPPLSKTGIAIMSINLLLPNEDDAVIWRGPLIAKAITQFWEEVLWGKLDYLLVDLPPGTADAPLTVMQSLPLSGVIIAFTPQDLAAMVVRKAVQMAQKMNVPIRGVVENMSYLALPDTGKRMEVFGRSKGQQMAVTAGAPLLAQLPIDPKLAELCDQGHIERYESDELGALGDGFLASMGGSPR
jgi:Mrp family chromosome partitioning ATPase